MYEIKITANSPAELQVAVFGLADSFGLHDNPAPAPVASESVVDSAVVGSIPEKKPRKPRSTAARKNAAQTAAAVKAAPTLEPVADSAPGREQIERSSVENAARAFAAKFGVAKAKEILSRFGGAGRVTEVPDDRLNDLYDAIQSASE